MNTKGIISIGYQINSDEDQLQGMFKMFDKDKNGILTRQELNEAFSKLGSKFPAWRTWRTVRHADANGDGCISEQEINELVKYALKRGYKLK
ncbi:hypothetical protein Pint_04813 [Pistacia integerrima]|uniref:Uncharacterized protein n=1 Tax=Pistacia integerrima TaxID=434235 RepID=A0ACC0Z4P0_9ROSI|nr:hypothetical protein Pint_04813 [Pistacia integerrima]